MPRKYSYIYSSLVEDEKDIIGHIAYSIYKQDKIEFIEKFKTDHSGTAQSENDLLSFHNVVSSSSQISSYRMKAEALVDDMMKDIIEQSIEECKKDVIASSEDRLKKIVQDLKPSWLTAILQSVVGALAFALLGAAFGFIKMYGGN